MNLHAALTQSHELHDDPRAFAGKLLADQRAINDALKAILDSDNAYILGFDVEEWETESNDLFAAWAVMFDRFRWAVTGD
jgi:hypothetical protein